MEGCLEKCDVSTWSCWQSRALFPGAVFDQIATWQNFRSAEFSTFSTALGAKETSKPLVIPPLISAQVAHI